MRPNLNQLTTAAIPSRRSSERYTLGTDLCLDVGRQRLERSGIEIPIPKLSFDFLLALVRAAPNVVTFDELAEQVWSGRVVQLETINQRAKLLRDALGDRVHSARVIRGARTRLCARLRSADGSGCRSTDFT